MNLSFSCSSISKLILVAFPLLVTTLVFAENKQTFLPQGYKVETIVTPKNVNLEVAGLDVNDQGTLAVSTRNGEVWLLPNAVGNNQIVETSWQRFSEGLGEATGILWDTYLNNNSLIVAQKPELTRLIDKDNDGKADQYINIANGWQYNHNYHEFNFGPVKDKQGNLYGTLNATSSKPGSYQWRGNAGMSNGGGYRGWAYQVSPQGDFIPFASGFRSPAGIGMSPQNEIFVTDNQGDWLPTSKLMHVTKGNFYGHPTSLSDHPEFTEESLDKMEIADFKKMMKKPVVWIPQDEVANSPGNPAWDTTAGKFGPFTNQIFIADHTRSNVFRVMTEKVKGEYQGAVINFIDGFQSGNIRIDFDKKGQLWVGQTGRGWKTAGDKPFGIQRVSWDGKTIPFSLLNIKLTKIGFNLEFTKEVDEKSVQLASLTAQQWHYNYWPTYGSPKVDEEDITLARVILLPDRKTIAVSMPLIADKVVALDFSRIRSTQNQVASATKVYYTLNNLLQ